MVLFSSDFFLPASKKRRAQKQAEAVNTIVSDCKEVGKCNALVAKAKKQKEEKRTRSGKGDMVSS